MKVRDCDGGPLIEIGPEHIHIRTIVDGIDCPHCGEEAFKIEPDLFKCYKCDMLWNVEI